MSKNDNAVKDFINPVEYDAEKYEYAVAETKIFVGVVAVSTALMLAVAVCQAIGLM